MQKVITSERIPIKLWLNDINEGALNQVRNLVNLPFAFKWIAVIPDSHECLLLTGRGRAAPA